MIGFFRRIRKKFADDNKPMKYMRYAIGEIVLVVVGILIALSINNWNEGRKNIQLAQDFKSRLIEDISADLSNIKERIRFFEEVRVFGYSAEKELNTKSASTVDEQWRFIINVFHASQIWPFRPTAAAYTEIQNSGLLGFIGPPELINKLSEFYVDNPVQLNQLSGGTTSYRDYVRSVIPIHVQHIIWSNCYDMTDADVQSFKECETPEINALLIRQLYTEIIDNPMFKGLLTRRLSTIYIRNFIYSGMAKKGEEIIFDIEDYKKYKN